MSPKNLLTLLACLACIQFCASVANAEESVVVVVILPFDLSGLDLSVDQKNEIRTYLGTRMTMEGVYKVMSDGDILMEIVKHKFNSWWDNFDEMHRKDLTKKLSADKAVSVKIVKERQICRVTGDLFDVVREIMEKAADVETKCGYEEIKNSMQLVAAQLSGQPVVSDPPPPPTKWVRLPGGTFQMGSENGDDDEKPVHSVTLSAFEIAATEVTVGQYRQCVQAGACTAPNDKSSSRYCNWGYSDRDNHPVNCIDWHQATAYAKWVGGRLPTEAEWEYAARSGGRNQEYPWGNQSPTCNYAVFSSRGDGCGQDRTWPVCSKPAGNTLQGLCDMAGNVWEWVSDWYESGYYAKSPSSNPTGPSSGSLRVIRGGSWSNRASYVRAALRFDLDPGYRLNYLGLRPARSVR